MELNEIELKKISECFNNFNSDNNYKEQVLKLYNEEKFNNISIYDIYVIEELSRTGNKNILQKLISYNPNTRHILKQTDDFIKTFMNDNNFQYYKSEQFQNNDAALSNFEKYIMEKLLKIKKNEYSEEKQNNEYVEAFVYSDEDYDEMNPLDYSNDYAIKRTVRNLLFGKFIHLLLNYPQMSGIASRQKMRGQIHKMDKDNIIDHILRQFTPQLEDQFNAEVDRIYAQFKIAKLFKTNNDTVNEYEQYNTNISETEIYAKRNNQYRKK